VTFACFVGYVDKTIIKFKFFAKNSTVFYYFLCTNAAKFSFF
jgi:hypothetical protein